MARQLASELKCPHCGAKVRRDWQSCWLCGLELHASTGLSPIASEASSTPAVAHESAAGPIANVVRFVGALIAFVLLMIFVGLMADRQFGGALGLLVLLLPAGLVTLTKALKRQSEGAAMTAVEKFGTFLLSLAVTIGAIVALGIAACVALLIACLAIVGSNGVNFH